MDPIQIVKERLAIAKAFVAGLGSNEAFLDDIGYLSFVLTLLPIPGVQQVAQVAQRVADNKTLAAKLGEVWQAINATNHSVKGIADLDSKVEAIANTVRYNSALQQELEAAIAELKGDLAESDTSWAVETSGCSTQELVDVIVKASNVTVSATDHSKNSLERVEVTARHTRLIATNGSHNSIKDSTFAGQQGAVHMNGDHAQRGTVTLQDASLGFAQNSNMQFNGWVMGSDENGFFIGKTAPAASPPALVCPLCKSARSRPENYRPLTLYRCPNCTMFSMLPP